MKWNLFNKKITAIFSVAIFFAVLMITSTFAGFITPVMAADEELELANIAKSANENTTLQLPRIIGSVDTPGHALDVFISGNHAFVADEQRDLQIIDISNPRSLVIIGSADTPGFAMGVYISGAHAFVADGWDGLQIIDVSAVIEDEVVPIPAFGAIFAILGLLAVAYLLRRRR